MRHNPDFNSSAVLETSRRLGERIRTARKAQKRTLVELEAACRVNRKTLARLEQGDPGVSLGVTLTVLEALRELADVELLVSNPETPSYQRSKSSPALDLNF
jgi:transcriptional regulator with XRE-family HTH domain